MNNKMQLTRNYRKCIICGIYRSPNSNVLLASFPIDPDRCRSWVKATGIEDFVHIPIEKLHQLKFICGWHFTPDCFNALGTRLRSTAVPTLGLTRPPLSDNLFTEFPLHVSSYYDKKFGTAKKQNETLPTREHKYSLPPPTTTAQPQPPREGSPSPASADAADQYEFGAETLEAMSDTDIDQTADHIDNVPATQTVKEIDKEKEIDKQMPLFKHETVDQDQIISQKSFLNQEQIGNQTQSGIQNAIIRTKQAHVEQDSDMSYQLVQKGRGPQKVIYITQCPPENVLACRGCLATDVQLFDLNGSNMKTVYEELIGIEMKASDKLPQYLCTFCIVQLRKFKDFREKCLRAHELLHNISGIKMLNTKFIKSVDRPFYNLNLNLEISNPVLMESDIIKEEVDLSDEKPTYVIKQEGDDEIYEVLDEATMDEDMEEMVHYVVEEDEAEWAMDNERDNVEPKTKKSKKTSKIFDLKAIGDEYNMDITALTEEEQYLEIEQRKTSKNYLRSNHRCEDCGKGFMSAETLTNHFNSIHHPDMGDYQCILCKSRFESLSKLNAHMSNHKYRFKCRECEFTTMRRWSASKHRNWHQGISFSCEKCNKDFNMHTSYLSHMRLHHPAEGVWCRYCGEQFVSELGLRAHRRLKHANTSNTEFICQVCGMTFLNEEAVTIHNANGCVPNSCALCGDSFEEEKSLQMHILEKHNPTGKIKVKRRIPKPEKVKKENLKKCELCDNLFNNANALERHTEMMGGACGGMRACVECGECFLTGDMLKEHVIDHHSEVEMLCPRCNRTFESSEEFNDHYKRVHMKKGPPRRTVMKTWGVTVNQDGPVIAQKGQDEATDTYSAVESVEKKTKSTFVCCEHCGKQCALKYKPWGVTVNQDGPVIAQKGQDEATDTYSAVESVEKKTKSTFVCCEHCGKQCASNIHLTYHLRIHTGEKPYKCAICQKAFAVPKFLKEHFKVHTGERPFDCEVCNKAFKSKSALNRHKLSHTGERRHICQICGKDFLTSSDVKTHIKTVHMKITGPPRIRKLKESACVQKKFN